MIALFLVCVLAPSIGAAEGGDKASDWATELGLFVFGGPASANVSVRLNGQMVAEIPEASGAATHEISGALETGINEFIVEFLGNDAPERDRKRLTVSLATSQLGQDGKRKLDESVAETSLPARPSATACTETYRFWAGPPPETTAELKKRYFLAIHGPPVGYLVTILVNDFPVYTTTRGERLVEVTAFIVKGQNRVLFEAVPGCFDGEIRAEGELGIFIAAGRMEGDEFRWVGQTLGEFDLRKQKNPEPITRQQNFRAR